MGNEDLADFAVKHALKLGATYAEARHEYSTGNAVSVKNGIPQAAGFESVEGLGIRIIFHGAVEFISTNWMDNKHVSEFVERGIKKASASARLMKEPIEFSREKTVKKKYEVKEKKKAENVGLDEKFEELFDAEKMLSGTGVAVPARFFSLSDGVCKKYYVNSEGSVIQSIIPGIGFSYLLTVVEKGESKQRYFQYYESAGYEALKKWNVNERIMGEAKAMKEILRKGKGAPKGVVNVVAAPEVVGIAVHESAGHPYEADRILGREAAQAGESFLTPEMVGKRIGTEIVNVVDDPLIENSAGHYLFDDEGVEARKKWLIGEGKIYEFLHNRESAYKMGMNSNGSARAMDYGSEPIVRMSNTYMLPGKMSEEELLQKAKNGVYVKSFTEWNIDDKRINQRYVSNEAYLIEKGELTKPVKQVVLETTTQDWYSSIEGLANNLEYVAGTCGKGEPIQGVPVWFGGPSILLAKMRL